MQDCQLIHVTALIFGTYMQGIIRIEFIVLLKEWCITGTHRELSIHHLSIGAPLCCKWMFSLYITRYVVYPFPFWDLLVLEIAQCLQHFIHGGAAKWKFGLSYDIL